MVIQQKKNRSFLASSIGYLLHFLCLRNERREWEIMLYLYLFLTAILDKMLGVN